MMSLAELMTNLQDSLQNILDSGVNKDVLVATLAATMATAFTGIILYTIKDLPLNILKFIWSRIRRRIVYTVHLEDYNEIYYTFNHWLKNNKPKSFRNVEAKFVGRDYNKSGASGYQFDSANIKSQDSFPINFYQRSDVQIIWWRKLPILLSKSRDKLEGATTNLQAYKDFYMLTSFFGKWHINSLLNELRVIAKEKNKKQFTPYVKSFVPSYWEHICPVMERSIDSIYYKGKSDIISGIDKFIASEEKYIKHGRPYKLGILFEGAPRTGKTSLVNALAHKYSRHINILNLKSIKSDNELINNCNIQNGQNNILLIEDFDSYFNGRNPEDGVSISFFRHFKLLRWGYFFSWAYSCHNY
jgi:hypothetical protein